MRTDPIRRAPPTERIALNGSTMGTRYAAVFYGSSAPDGLADALHRAVTTVDDQMSTWKPASDLMRFNRAPVGEWIELPVELLYVVDAGLAIGRATGGAFDIGVLDLVAAWGFNRKDGQPDGEQVERLATLARRPAYDLVERDPVGRRMRKRAPVSLDLSGIAKGYGVDRLAETMDAFGIDNHIVSIDGEVRARGRRADGMPWRVGLEAPVPGRREVTGSIDLDNAALATSGDYRHRMTLGDRTVAHTMDPRRGRPLDNGIQAVTVRAPTCMQADAWATAVMVLGEPALPLLHSRGMDALIAVPGI